jgi:hypothetical protein
MNSLLGIRMEAGDRCDRCQRYKANDGLLFCPRCAGRGRFTQDVEIRVPAVSTEKPQRTVWSKVRARVWVGRQKLESTRWDRVRYRKRDRDEVKTQVYDQPQKVHRESWYHPESDEDWMKFVPLNHDADLHGVKSGHLFRLRHRQGSLRDGGAQQA